MEYVFSDTRKELPETYEYLERIEDYLGTQCASAERGLGVRPLVRGLRRK